MRIARKCKDIKIVRQTFIGDGATKRYIPCDTLLRGDAGCTRVEAGKPNVEPPCVDVSTNRAQNSRVYGETSLS